MAAASSASSSHLPGPSDSAQVKKIGGGTSDAAEAVLRAAAAATAEIAKGGQVAGTGISKEIEELRELQKKQRTERKKLCADLRNARKRRNRLKNKAKLLSNDDLVAVFQMRSETMAAQAAKKEAAVSHSPGKEAENAPEPAAKQARVEKQTMSEDLEHASEWLACSMLHSIACHAYMIAPPFRTRWSSKKRPERSVHARRRARVPLRR